MSGAAGATNGERKSSSSGHHQAKTRGPGQPLRRGDACLMCRAKKLKCSAQKPVCDQCVKRKDRCVYDGVRPASRVEQLQRKLAEMEDEELREAFEARRRESMDRFAFMVPPSQPMKPLSSSMGQDTGIPLIPNQWNYGLSTMPPSASGSADSTPAMNGHALGPSPPLTTGSSGTLIGMQDTIESTWPWATPQSDGFMSVTPDYRASFPQNGHDSSPAQRDHNLWSMLGSSAEHSPFYGVPEDRKPFINQNLSPFIGSQPDITIGIPTLHRSVVSSPDLSHHSPRHIGHPEGPHPTSPLTSLGAPVSGASDVKSVANGSNEIETPANLASHLPSIVKEVVDSVMETKKALDEKYIKAYQISDFARDYLLNLFFYPVPPRPRCGSEVFTETQFRAKLALPLLQQPHPCMVFSMYATATSHSYVPAIRKLGETLFTIAMYHLDEAVRHGDRLIDAINASKNLSKWLYAKGRLLEGYQVSCRAISLCMACGLHQIPSSCMDWPSNVHPYPQYTIYSQPLLPAAKSQAELCERIHAFWSAWGNDRGGCIIHNWPSAIRDDQIITPLPRPAEDYHTSLVHVEPDITLRDLYDLPHRQKVKPFTSLYKYTLTVCHLVHRAISLSSLPPETAAASYRALTHGRSPSLSGQTSSIRKSHPIAYEEIMNASLWLEENMPQQWKVNPTGSQIWTAPDVPVVTLGFKIARMHLHSVYVPNDRDTALNLAFECAELIKLWLDNLETNIQIQERSLLALSNESLLIAIHDLTSEAQTTSNGNNPFSHNAMNGHVNDDGETAINSSPQSDGQIKQTITAADLSPDTPGTFRNLNGISGPYCLSPVLSVIKCLVQGQRVLMMHGHQQDANRCATEVGELVKRLKDVGANGSIPKEYIDKLEQVVDHNLAVDRS
ncbi:hypothetical protein IAU59_006813 [Kwoniella sp. CBS 9459]